MEIRDFLLASLRESGEYVRLAIDDLTRDELSFSPGPECNSIAFIYWHVARVEDWWINRVFLKEDEIYESDGWCEKLGTPAEDNGCYYTAEQVRAWPMPEIDVLNGYAHAVRSKTIDFVQSLSPEKLEEDIDVIGRPVPLGVYLSHVITEIALHAGQISYIRGILRGIEPHATP